MFERFTPQARRVLACAQREAQDLHHTHIGTEHLLLGLLAEPEGAGGRALVDVGVDIDRARFATAEMIGEVTQPAMGHLPFTPRAKKVLELALRNALNLGHQRVGTGHLLLGVLDEGEGVGVQVFLRLGFRVDGLESFVTSQLLAPETDLEGVREGPQRGTQQVSTRGGLLDEIVERLGAVEDRMDAIERLLREREAD